MQIIVSKIAKGIANNAVGKGPREIPYDWKNHVKRIANIAPKDMRSPWEKFAKRSTA